ncbi:hypothetical protein EBB07_15845 [Paenibacillaceae bacterium]|nr:hypothetical protein EBB07_15845 [Paenibacillaceae bacterium]
MKLFLPYISPIIVAPHPLFMAYSDNSIIDSDGIFIRVNISIQKGWFTMNETTEVALNSNPASPIWGITDGDDPASSIWGITDGGDPASLIWGITDDGDPASSIWGITGDG